MLQAVQIDPEVQGRHSLFCGHARARWKSLFDYLARDRSLDYFLEQFPTVKREHAMTVLDHAEHLLEDDSRKTQAA